MVNTTTSEHDVIAPVESLGQSVDVAKITFGDLRDALAAGIEDFRAMPTHAVFLGIIYAVVGLVLARAVFGYAILPMLYPLAAGFALIGPFAAIGLYELSRRREEGRDTHWLHVFDVRHSPSFKSILALGAMLLLLFVVWISVAQGLYEASFGRYYHETFAAFWSALWTTPKGQWLLLVGNLVGFAFALVALAVSVVSFPIMLDRHVGVAAAVAASLKALLKNPVTMLAWGAVVAALLLLGTLPLFFGLAVVVPVLGHATWHLYRKVIVPDRRRRPEFVPRVKHPHYAADFPASLFVPSVVNPPDDKR